MKYRAIILLLISCLLVASCDKQGEVPQQVQPARSIDSTLSNETVEKHDTDLNHIEDSLLNGHAGIARFYLARYHVDSCEILPQSDSVWIKSMRDFHRMRDINGNHRSYDSVFVLPPLSFCEEGSSYYFLDTTLPRLHTDSECCQPQNMFEVGDIDEDHVREIGLYYSSCTSRYKTLFIYSLNNEEWKEVGGCIIDILYAYNPDHRRYVRKTGRGSFEMLETYDPNKMDVKRWVKFKM
jgi:hypothetical protein